ncbi:hypothetical protein GOP47_0008093 [Adiantum capillus-veneris]|uniref:Leucine-rich repeat-containing N-terminal plant-type domain-containing protein n=1 Tax=Adiantum capillus-veneris TaxID=13818 RepID=A0A9D4ZHQ7_ADICA|nr:hypothetical protein GOP47_0008093 [Adiantum capillus-veneris]
MLYLSESWSGEHDCCTWEGVTCSTTPTSIANHTNVIATSSVLEAGACVTAHSLYFYKLSILPSATAMSSLESLFNLPLLSTLQLPPIKPFKFLHVFWGAAAIAALPHPLQSRPHWSPHPSLFISPPPPSTPSPQPLIHHNNVPSISCSLLHDIVKWP